MVSTTRVQHIFGKNPLFFLLAGACFGLQMLYTCIPAQLLLISISQFAYNIYLEALYLEAL